MEIGQRVRVNTPYESEHDKHGTVIKAVEGHVWGYFQWEVLIDGHFSAWMFREEELEAVND